MEYTILTIAPIVLFPFAAFVINAFLGRKLYREGDWLSVLGIFLSFVWSFLIFKDFIFQTHAANYVIHKVIPWMDLSFGKTLFKIDLGIYIDNMTAVMLLMVSGVATLIHLFSTYYMHDDPRYGKFFIYLSLFTTAMLGLVLSDNLLGIFIFWEIMGFCSYSLIGFYMEKERAGYASIKAFMTTRVGDVCFLLGMMAIWSVVGSVGIVDIYKALDAGLFAGKMVMGIPLISFAAFCIFCGTIGKSAQFPLQVWLPDAMMGPTPCSALIHAATMVAAGVYLSLRMYPVMVAGDLTTFIAVIGAITAFGAATIALVQNDIKGVLAFSTVSQLGYMVMGIGVGAYNPSFMHLITHAVFKACLFLSAGSVIHSLHDHHTDEHVQDMRRMGGLKKLLPWTHLAMLACSLAIAGVPFFSGFVSKDRILGDALFWAMTHSNRLTIIVPILGFSAAFLTAFYMFRMMFLTFYGQPRDEDLHHHVHKEGLQFNRNVPLLILTVFTLGFFYCGSLTGQGKVFVFPEAGREWFQTLIQKPELATFRNAKSELFGSVDTRVKENLPVTLYHAEHGESQSELAHIQHQAHTMGAILSLIIAFSGIFLSYLMYGNRKWNPGYWVNRFPRLNQALHQRYYFDDFYEKVILARGLLPLNRALAFFDMGIYDRFAIDGWEAVNRWIYRFHGWFDQKVVDNAVDATGLIVRFFNVILRTLQSGRVQVYFLVLIFVLSSYIWMINF